MTEHSGSWWGYLWATATGAFTLLTPQDFMFAIGGIITAILGILTYVSNSRKNKQIVLAQKAAADAERERVLLLAQYLQSRKDGQIPDTPKEIIETIALIEGDNIEQQTA
ncbi:MAG: hypothetical protein E5Y74_00235 [Mesorhizobium sp.]|nr:MAG: hypothetical protein E5Y74_00235 [Mesorhizobium sp.]